MFLSRNSAAPASMRLRFSSSCAVIWLNDSASSASSSSAIVVDAMRQIAARDLVRSFGERFDRRRDTTRQINRHPTRDKQQDQRHQSERRKSEQTHAPLFPHQILVVTFRIGNQICQIVRRAFCGAMISISD